MSYRSKQTCLARGLPVVLAAMSLALGAARGPIPMAAPSEPADKPPRFQAVLVNGGGQPAINFHSHLLHVQQLSDVLRRAGSAGWQRVRFLLLNCCPPGIRLLSGESGQGQRRPLVCLH